MLRWALGIGGVLLAAIALATGGALVWARTDGGQRWILARVLDAAQPHGGSLEIASMSTDLWSSLHLEGVRIRDGAGRELAGLDSLDARFEVLLLKRALHVESLVVDGLRGDMDMGPDGLDIAAIWTRPEPAPVADEPYAGLPIDLIVDGIAIRATDVLFSTDAHVLALGDARLTGGLRFEGDRILVSELALDAARTTPDLGALALRLDMSYDADRLQFDDLDLSLGSQHIALSGALGDLGRDAITAGVQLTAVHLDLDALPWALPVHGAFESTGEITGLLDAPVVMLQLQTPGGPVRIDATHDRRPARPTWKADVSTTGLALDRFVYGLDPTLVVATVTAEGAGSSWPADLDGRATISGTASVAPVVGWANLQGSVELSQGVVHTQELRLSTPTGVLVADARVDIVGSTGAASLRSLDVNLADLARFGVTGARGTARFVGDVTGDWSGAAPVASAQGVLSGRGLALKDNVSVATLRAPVDVRLARGRIEAADIDFRATALQAGPVSGDRAWGRLALRRDRLVLRFDLMEGERTVIGADANGDLRTRRFELPRLVLSPDARTWTGAGVQTFTLADDGFDALRLVLVSGDASLSAAGTLHTRGDVGLALAAVDLPLDMLGRFSPTMAGTQGLVQLNGAVSGSFERIELAVVGTADGLAVPGVVHGVDLDLRLEGREDRVAVDVAVATDLASPQVLATLRGTVPVSLNLRDPAFLSSSPVALTLDVPAGTSESWNTVLDAAELPPLRGSASVALTGTPLHPDLHVVAAVEVPPPYRREDWPGLDLDLATAASQLTVKAGMRQGETQMAALEGGARVGLDRVASALLGSGPAVDLADPATWIDELDLTLRPLDLSVQSLTSFVAIPEGVTGRIQGEIHATGSPRAPVLDGALSVEQAKLDELAVSPATLSFRPGADGYDLLADFGFASEGGLHVGAHVPLELGAPLSPQWEHAGLELAVKGQVPLRAIAAVWPELRQAVGGIELDGAVTGSIAAPVPHLRASARDASFELERTGVVYDEVGFDLIVEPTAARLDNFHVQTSAQGSRRKPRGSIDASVQARLDGTKLGEWTGKIVYDRPYIAATGDELLRLAAGEVTLSGTPPNIKINGTIEVEEAKLNFDERFFSGAHDTALPAWVHVHRGQAKAGAEVAVVEEDEDTGIPDWLQLTLGLDLARNLFLHVELPLDASVGNLLGSFATVRVDTQADGQLQIAAHDGVLSVQGQVLPLRGTTVLFGRAFEIRDDSTISFTGTDFASPVLDLHAVYDARTYGLVEAHISGIPNALVVELSAEEYPSQDDVISLLLVGRPASEVSAGEGDGASSAALSMLLGTVTQRVGRQGAATAAMFIAPDLLVIGAESARVGKRIGNRIFVVVDIDNTADDIKSSYLLLTIELALGGPWQGEFTHGTAGEDEVGVYWTRRY